MELELGLKITRTRDDLTSEIRIIKDRAGPLFLSRETETMFVLTAHLKGFKRERIKIAINEDGNQIAISGEKSIQEMVMVKWIMYKKEAEIREFRKAFWIPDGIILDQIKAKFNEEDSILTIVMPKKTRGIRGIEIEEVKQENSDGETSERDDVQDDLKPETEKDDPIGEITSESPKISHEEESPGLTSSATIEVPATALPDNREQVVRPEELKVESDGELNQSNAPDSLSLEEMAREDLPTVQPEETEELKVESVGELNQSTAPDSLPLEEMVSEDLPTIQPEETEELKVESDEELNQSNAPDSLPLEEMEREELPTVQPEETEEHEIPKIKAPECEPHEHDLTPVTIGLHEPQTPETKKTTGFRGIEIEEMKHEHFDGETSERDDVQKELKPETEKDDPIGEYTSESPKISLEEGSSELTSAATIEVPGTALPGNGEEIVRPEELKVESNGELVREELPTVQPEETEELKMESDGELNQSHVPDSLSWEEEMVRQELPTVQPEETEEHEIPEVKATEFEPHEHDLTPDATEGLHEPQTPETKKTTGIRGFKIEEMKREYVDGDTYERDDVQEKLQPETEDDRIGEISSESPKISHEEESSELTSPATIEVPATALPDNREEVVRPEELKVESDEELNQSNAPDSLLSEEMVREDLPTVQPEQRKELKVELDGELNQSTASDSLPSEEMAREEFPTVQPEETEEHEIPEVKAPECEPHEHDLTPDTTKGLHEPQTPETKKTTGIRGFKIEEMKREHIDGETSERDDVQEKLQSETEDDRIGEISSESPKISHEEESSELTSPATIEVPATALPDNREEVVRPEELKVESDEELNQSNAPDSLPSEEMVREDLPTVQPEERKELKVELDGELNQSKAPDSLPSEEMVREDLPTVQPEERKEHEIHEVKAPECEAHEHDLAPDTTEPEQRLHEPQTPETPQTRQIGNEELPQKEIIQVPAAEPKPELKEEHRDPEIGPPETPDLDQPVAQEIEDHELGVAEEAHEEVPEVREEEIESEKAEKEKSPTAEPKKSVCDRSTQTEKWQSEEADKEESPKAEPKKSVCDRSTQTEEWHSREPPLEEVELEEADKEESSKAEPMKRVCDRSTQTEKCKSRKLPLCPSLFAGSFLVSLIVLVIQLLRKKKKR
ncbi:microtubule-associated protein futsch-like [Telopea speciosissima]|uniref:microtubule-associated protein futsch-like n=1 Tax=Telopea speciosissima TaxID=54955 RepID=UPI001CC5EE39|nr:microtubule-associated protein futsch-like [Telopea speciosissima]